MVYHQQMYFLPMHTDALFRIQNSAQLGTIVRTRLMQGLIAFAVRGIAFHHFYTKANRSIIGIRSATRKGLLIASSTPQSIA